jgi:hypothetical protein
MDQTFQARRKMRLAEKSFPANPSAGRRRPCAQKARSVRAYQMRIQTMQRVTVVRYTTKPDQAAQNEALSRAVFAQLRSAPPEGVAYALFRDGYEFIHVFLNLKADESAPVTELPAFKTFEKGIAERCDLPPKATRLAATLVDRYGFGADATIEA